MLNISKKLLVAAVVAWSMLMPLGGVVMAQSSATSTQTTSTSPSVAQQAAERIKSSWPWYIVRAAGIIAAISLVLLLLSGVGQITGYTFRLVEPITAWATHRALGLVFMGSVFVHILALLFDKFVTFNIWQVLIPFVSPYRPVTLFGRNFGSLYVALGVLSFYLMLTIVITSLVWIDKKPHTWKLLHFFSYLTMIFVFLHALYIGTDLAVGWLKVVWIVLGIIIAGATILRLWRAKTI